MENLPFDEVDDDDGPGVWIVEDRPALREGMIFVDYSARRVMEFGRRRWQLFASSVTISHGLCR